MKERKLGQNTKTKHPRQLSDAALDKMTCSQLKAAWDEARGDTATQKRIGGHLSKFTDSLGAQRRAKP